MWTASYPFNSQTLLFKGIIIKCSAVMFGNCPLENSEGNEETLPCNLKILDVVSFCIVVTLWLVVVNI